VYIRSDGQVRYNFTHPKQVLDIMRIVSADKHSPDEALCRFFDQQTTNCSDMHVYADLIERAVAQIRDAFTKRIATQTTTSRGFVIPKLGQQVQSVADFTLITWMVILP
jgi:hypothetical protein